jgi:hypothetical protein
MKVSQDERNFSQDHRPATDSTIGVNSQQDSSILRNISAKSETNHKNWEDALMVCEIHVYS